MKHREMHCCNGNFAVQQIGAILVAVVACLAMAGCESLPSIPGPSTAISTKSDYCCRPAAEKVRSYRVEFEDMPEFLKPMMRDEASIVLASKGLDYTEGDADAILTMTYIGTPLVAEKGSEEGIARFVAEVKVEMQNSITSELISSGSLSRIHNAPIDAYMHEAPARRALHTAFTELFSDYPDLIYGTR